MYDDSGTHYNNRACRVLASEVILLALLAVPTSVPIKLVSGFVSDRPVSVIFYSGTIFGINKRLVPRSVYTGRYVKCLTLPGHVECFPLRRMFIKTLYYSGYAEIFL